MPQDAATNAKVLLERASGSMPWIEARLRELVLQESPTEDPEAVNAAGRMVSAWAVELGGDVRLHQQTNFGDVLEINFGAEGETSAASKPILLLGHLDTVWPRGTLATMPWRSVGGRFHGPGVVDMKAGVVMALAALSILKDAGLSRPVTLLLNSEEEVGSPVSRPLTEAIASRSAAVYVLEPAQGLAYKTARKGIGHYILEVSGVAAHSGVDFTRGHSAIREIARQIEVISGFTDLSRGLTVNCGVVSGGTRSNVIADRAIAEIDVRIATASDAEHVDALFADLRPTDPGCTLKLSGGINRPPMERRQGTIALFETAKKLAAEMGFNLDEAATGGGSDGNFTAALGVPTLDGMGAVGEGAHATHESVQIEHLAPRTALLAGMILHGCEAVGESNPDFKGANTG